MDVFAEADEVNSAAMFAVKPRSSDANLAPETPSDSPTTRDGSGGVCRVVAPHGEI